MTGWEQEQMERDEFFRRLEDTKEFIRDFGGEVVLTLLKLVFGSVQLKELNKNV